MHKNRPVRIIHLGLKMRESDPVKLIAKATIPIGVLLSKHVLNDLRRGMITKALHVDSRRYHRPVKHVLPHNAESEHHRIPPKGRQECNGEQNGEVVVEPRLGWSGTKSADN